MQIRNNQQTTVTTHLHHLYLPWWINPLFSLAKLIDSSLGFGLLKIYRRGVTFPIPSQAQTIQPFRLFLLLQLTHIYIPPSWTFSAKCHAIYMYVDVKAKIKDSILLFPDQLDCSPSMYFVITSQIQSYKCKLGCNANWLYVYV